MSLITEAHFHDPKTRYFQAYGPGDDFYAMLIDCHRDLSVEDSASVNARLVLLLANHIGDLNVLRAALHAARHGYTASTST